jgi:hypothetical protein
VSETDRLIVHEIETTPHPRLAQARLLKHALYGLNLVAVVALLGFAAVRGYVLAGLLVAAWMTAVTAGVAWLLERWEESASWRWERSGDQT